MSPLELPMVPAGTSGAPAASEPERDVHADGRRFRVEGMDCAACAKTVEKVVAALDGVATAQVSFGAGTLVVEGDTPEAAITASVSRAGYRARPAERRAAGPQVPF